MSTPKDRQRTEAFRAWLKHIGSIEAAQAATGINTRSLERMRAGKKPPPVALLQALALLEKRRAPNIARQLLAAQMPTDNGHKITGVWFDELSNVDVAKESGPTLHVDWIMFGRMQEHASKADFFGVDPSIAALAPTGLDWKAVQGKSVRVIADLETPDDRPDGIAMFEGKLTNA